MIKLVEWDKVIDGKDIAEWFIELGHLNDADSAIIRGRRDGKYQFEVSDIAGIAEDTVKYRTNKLIEKYKRLAKSYPNILLFKKEYEQVSAVVSLITNDKIYSIAFENEYFDTFDDIKNEVIKRIEKQYKVKIPEIGKYRTAISGTYIRNTKE